MALASTIKEGATTVAATGGTDVTLVSLGIRGNVNPMSFSTDANLATRRSIEFGIKPVSVSPSSPGQMTLARNTVKFRQPKTLVSLEKAINGFNVEVFYHPETTQAEVEQIMETLAQVTGGVNFMSFYKDQSLL